MQRCAARPWSVGAKGMAMDERSAEEFREYMHGRWPSMVRLAYGLTGDQGHAEDVAAAAFARACASWPRVRRSGNPDAPHHRGLRGATGSRGDAGPGRPPGPGPQYCPAGNGSLRPQAPGGMAGNGKDTALSPGWTQTRNIRRRHFSAFPDRSRRPPTLAALAGRPGHPGPVSRRRRLIPRRARTGRRPSPVFSPGVPDREPDRPGTWGSAGERPLALPGRLPQTVCR